MHPSSLFGDDIFISYSRADGSLYAAGLADELTKRKFACFLDQLGTDPDQDLPASLKRKIRNCTVCVLVGTERALISESVEKEIVEFKKTRRTIIPIYFEGVAEDSSLSPLIPGLARSSETNAALMSGDPSHAVISRIEKSFNYTRRNVRMRRVIMMAMLLFVIVIGATAFAGAFAVSEGKRALRESANAQQARRSANDEKDKAVRAEEQRIVADRKADAAQEKAKNATVEAEKQLTIAKNAEVKRKDAERQTERAIRRQEIANLETKAAQATALSQRSGNEDKALVAGIESVAPLLHRTARPMVTTDGLYDAVLAARKSFILIDEQEERRFAGAAVSPDGKQVAAIDSALSSPTPDSEMLIVDARTGERLKTLRSWARGAATSIKYSPNGKLIGVLTDSPADTFRYLYIWDAGKLELLREVRLPYEINSFVFSFDKESERIATNSDFKTQIWRARTGELLQEIDQVTGLAFSHDGKSMLTDGVAPAANGGPQGLIWNLEGGKPKLISNLKVFINTADISCAQFSIDDARIVTGQGSVVALWDTKTGELIQALYGHGDSVLTVGYSSFDRIVSASADGTALVWNRIGGPENQRTPAVLEIAPGRVSSASASFFGDDRFVLTSGPAAVRVWYVAKEKDELAKLIGFKPVWISKWPEFPTQTRPTLSITQLFSMACNLLRYQREFAKSRDVKSYCSPYLQATPVRTGN